MKNEEFNEFLKNRAEGFEMKPSSGSFDAMFDKLNKKPAKKRGFWVPLLAACMAGALCVWAYSTYQSNNAGLANQNTPVQQQAGADKQENRIPLGPPPKVKENIGAPAQAKTNTADVAANQSAITPLQRSAQQNTRRLPVDNTINPNQTVETTVIPGEGDDNSVTKESDEPVLTQTEPLPDTSIIIADGSETPLQQPEVPGEAESPISAAPAKNNNIKPDNKNKCNCAGKWAVQVYYNPFVTSYYRTRNNAADTTSPKVMFSNIGQGGSYDVVNNQYSEMPLTGFEAGVKVARKISGHWAITTGLAYNRWENKITETHTVSSVDSVENFYFDPYTQQNVKYYSASYQEKDYKQTTTTSAYSSLQIPLLAQYTFEKGRWGLMAQAGISIGYTFGRTERIKTQTWRDTGSRLQPSAISAADYNSKASEVPYRAFNFNLSSGVAVSYRFSKCASIYAGPRFSAAMLSYNTKDPAGQSVNNVAFRGIETGLKINL